MISYFPDLNVWLALSDNKHQHSSIAWSWLHSTQPESPLYFSRYTQIGLIRLLTNQKAMGEGVLTLGRAWEIYDGWIQDSRISFHSEPIGMDVAFRNVTHSFKDTAASRWVGDCYLLAYASQLNATLVTFDKALHALAQKQGHSSLIPN